MDRPIRSSTFCESEYMELSSEVSGFEQIT